MEKVIRQEAATGTQFEADAFNEAIGKRRPLTVADWSGMATLVSAEVIENGAAVLLTVETDDLGGG